MLNLFMYIASLIKESVIKKALTLYEFLKKSFLTKFQLMGSIEKLPPTFYLFNLCI